MANARLIAAAPDLLEALKLCVAHFAGEYSAVQVLPQACDAIARATGGSSPSVEVE